MSVSVPLSGAYTAPLLDPLARWTAFAPLAVQTETETENESDSHSF